MNEAELIKQYRELLKQIEEKKSALKSALKYSNSDRADQLTSDTETLENQKEGIISVLKSSSDKTLTSKKIENVKSILIQLKNKFSKKDYPHKLSRDQGTIVHGYILIQIISDISNAFENHDRFSVSDYYLEVGSEFNSDELLNLFQESIQYLDSNLINNYIELYEFIKSLRENITSLDKDLGTY